MAGQYIQGQGGKLFVDQPGLANPAANVVCYNHLLHKEELLYLMHSDGVVYTWKEDAVQVDAVPPVMLWDQAWMGTWPWGYPPPQGQEAPPLDVDLPPSPPSSDSSAELSFSEDEMLLAPPPQLPPLETSESEPESDQDWQALPINAPGYEVKEEVLDLERDDEPAPEVMDY